MMKPGVAREHARAGDAGRAGVRGNRARCARCSTARRRRVVHARATAYVKTRITRERARAECARSRAVGGNGAWRAASPARGDVTVRKAVAPAQMESRVAERPADTSDAGRVRIGRGSAGVTTRPAVLRVASDIDTTGAASGRRRARTSTRGARIASAGADAHRRGVDTHDRTAPAMGPRGDVGLATTRRIGPTVRASACASAGEITDACRAVNGTRDDARKRCAIGRARAAVMRVGSKIDARAAADRSHAAVGHVARVDRDRDIRDVLRVECIRGIASHTGVGAARVIRRRVTRAGRECPDDREKRDNPGSAHGHRPPVPDPLRARGACHARRRPSVFRCRYGTGRTVGIKLTSTDADG